MVTIAYGESIQHLITMTGVKPGDELVVGEKEDEGERGDTVRMAKVRLPSADVPGAARLRVSLGIGATETRAGATLALPILKRLVGSDRRFRVLGEAVDDAGKPLAYAFAAPSVGEADVDVPLERWHTDFRDVRVVLTSPPSGIDRASATLAMLAGDERWDRGRRDAAIRGDTTIAFAIPRPLANDALLRVDLGYEGSDDRASVLQRSPAFVADDVKVDLEKLTLPRVSNARVERTPDERRPVVRWEGSTKEADATIARLVWPATGEHVWTIATSRSSKRRSTRATPT